VTEGKQQVAEEPTQEEVRLVVHVPEQTFREFKAVCAREGETMKAVICALMALEVKMYRDEEKEA